MMMLRTFQLTLMLAAAAFASSAAAAWAPNKAELATLPAYCAARFDGNSEAFKTWRASMGPDFQHIHHYCAGLNFLNRAHGTASAKARRGSLGAAMNNFDYMLSHVSPGFYLRSEILMNRGIAQAMLQNPGAAIGDLLKAIEMDPKQPRAYVALADVYEKMKSRDKALSAVVAGLRHNPGTTSLQRRYTELGGKLPYPAPNVAAPAAAADAPVAATAVDEPDAADPAPGADTPVADAADTPKIGSPTNPYCRFCPD